MNGPPFTPCRHRLLAPRPAEYRARDRGSPNARPSPCQTPLPSRRRLRRLPVPALQEIAAEAPPLRPSILRRDRRIAGKPPPTAPGAVIPMRWLCEVGPPGRDTSIYPGLSPRSRAKRSTGTADTARSESARSRSGYAAAMAATAIPRGQVGEVVTGPLAVRRRYPVMDTWVRRDSAPKSGPIESEPVSGRTTMSRTSAPRAARRGTIVHRDP